jgi:hypothetical protein
MRIGSPSAAAGATQMARIGKNIHLFAIAGIHSSVFANVPKK